MWCWGRMQKTPWKDTVSNDEVLKVIKREKKEYRGRTSLEENKWSGHLIRYNAHKIAVLEGKINGRQCSG